MDTVEQLVSDFSQWAAKVHMPASSRRKFPKSLRRVINEKLLRDDEGIDIVTRPLNDSENLTCQFDSPEQWLYRYAKDEELVAGVIAPAWGYGWPEYEKDAFLEGIFSSFFDLASQYVRRSRIANLIGAIALTYEKACEFRHGGFAMSYATNDELAKIRKQHLARNWGVRDKYHFQGAKKREFSAWVKSINCLDPYVHQAVFQFWRATELFDSNYLAEAVTALDGVTAIAARYLNRRMKVAGEARNKLQVSLGLSETDSKHLKTLYELRCDFGAHPSQSNWWDFGEIYDEDLLVLRNSVKQLLWLLCKSEQANRVVEPCPQKWSEWFRENALMLYNSVWFKLVKS